MTNLSDLYKNIGKLGEIAQRISVPQIQPTNFKEYLELRADLRNYDLADYQFEVLKKTIQRFESNLDDDHEVAVQLSSFGQSILMHVQNISYSNPSLLHFHGFVNGRQSELIQHINQLNFLILAQKKDDPEKPAIRIGFVQDDLNDLQHSE